MDELLIQGQWWWLLVVPVATGAFALAGSWWGSRLGRSTEHQQWVRNQKLEIYKEVQIASADVVRAFARGLTEKDGGSPDIITAVTKFERIPVSLFYSQKVADAYTGMLDAVMILSSSSGNRGTEAYREVVKSANSAVDILRNEMRADVNIRT